MTDPEHFATLAIPDDKKWQLINVPYSIEKFASIPHFKPDFFRYNVQVITDFKGKLHTKDGIIEISLKRKDNSQSDGILTYKLSFGGKDQNKSCPEEFSRSLSRCVLMMRYMSQWIFHVRLPTPGVYMLTIFGGKSLQQVLPICDFKILCDATPFTRKILPIDAPMVGWGPSSYTEKIGLTNPTHSKGIVKLKIREECIIGFDTNKK